MSPHKCYSGEMDKFHVSYSPAAANYLIVNEYSSADPSGSSDCFAYVKAGWLTAGIPVARKNTPRTRRMPLPPDWISFIELIRYMLFNIRSLSLSNDVTSTLPTISKTSLIIFWKTGFCYMKSWSYKRLKIQKDNKISQNFFFFQAK